MEQKSIPIPVVVVLITVVVLMAGVFLYKGLTGGTVGDGHEGRIEASPPMPNAAAAKDQMRQQAHSQTNGGIRP